MFSKDLETLIQAALADGNITEKERAVLHKRAEAEGVDPDELDMIIDARLTKANQPVPQKAEQTHKPKKESITQELSRQLAQAQQKYERRLSNVDDSWYDGLARDFESSAIERERDKTMETVIRNFHVPNDREDLLDFILLCKKSYSVRDNEARRRREYNYTTDNKNLNVVDRAYIEKSRELMDRAKAYFPEDKVLMNAIAEIERMEQDLNLSNLKVQEIQQKKREEDKAKKAREKKINTIKIIGLSVFVLIIIISAILIVYLEE